MDRAYSILTVEKMDDEKREIVGIASTPVPDKAGDIVESTGATFSLPIPFLWHHDKRAPIGEVIEADVTNAGIRIKARIAKVSEAGIVKNRLDEAWHSIKAGLVRGLSVGFVARKADAEPIKETGGYRFFKWRWDELSAVTVPANQQATILSVKSADQAARRTGTRPIVRLNAPPTGGFFSPGASGKSVVYLRREPK